MANPQRHSSDIAKWQLEKKEGYVVGGRHTAQAVKNLMEKAKGDIPVNFQQWPTKAILLPGGWEEWTDQLLALGVMDNENLALSVHWHDMLEKCREMFKLIFDNKPYSQGSREQKTRLKKNIQTICRCSVNTAGTWRMMCTVDDEVFKYYRMLYLGTYVKAELLSSTDAMNLTAKKGRPAGHGKAKGCGWKDLTQFSAIDTEWLVPILRKVVEGRMTFKAAVSEAAETRAYCRMRHAFDEYCKTKKYSTFVKVDDKKVRTIYDYKIFSEQFTSHARSKFEQVNIIRFKTSNWRVNAAQQEEFHRNIDKLLRRDGTEEEDGDVDDPFLTPHSIKLTDILTPAAKNLFRNSTDGDPITLISTKSSSVLCLRTKTQDLASFIAPRFMRNLYFGTFLSYLHL